MFDSHHHEYVPEPTVTVGCCIRSRRVVSRSPTLLETQNMPFAGADATEPREPVLAPRIDGRQA
jgi:hypothetical protein